MILIDSSHQAPRVQPKQGKNGEGCEWEQQREEEAMSSQVVHYCDQDGNHATWLGGQGEEPARKIRELLSPSYSPTKASKPKNPFSTSGCTLDQVPAMLKLRLGQR